MIGLSDEQALTRNSYKVAKNSFVVSIAALIVSTVLSVASIKLALDNNVTAQTALTDAALSGKRQDSVNKSTLSQLKSLEKALKEQTDRMDRQGAAMDTSVIKLRQIVTFSTKQIEALRQVIDVSHQYVRLTERGLDYQRKQVEELERKQKAKPNLFFQVGDNPFFQRLSIRRNGLSELSAIKFVKEKDFDEVILVDAEPIYVPGQALQAEGMQINIVLLVQNKGDEIAENPHLQVQVFDTSDNPKKFYLTCLEDGVSTVENVPAKPIADILLDSLGVEPSRFHFKLDIRNTDITNLRNYDSSMPKENNFFMMSFTIWANKFSKKTKIARFSVSRVLP